MNSIGTEQLRALLRNKYRPKEWAFLEEVRNQTGYGKNERYADAIAMNLYPSRGLEVLGFEIKSSRGDWQRELNLPDKSVPIQKYCDRWWIVATADVVHKGELPKTWGLMEATHDFKELKVKVDAPQLEAVPLDRKFIASMMRNLSETFENKLVRAEQSGAQYKKGYQAAKDELERVMQYEHSATEAQLKALQISVKEFYEKSGVNIDQWNGGRLGEVVRIVERLGFRNGNVDEWMMERLKRAISPLTDIITAINHMETAFSEFFHVDVADETGENEEDEPSAGLRGEDAEEEP